MLWNFDLLPSAASGWEVSSSSIRSSMGIVCRSSYNTRGRSALDVPRCRLSQTLGDFPVFAITNQCPYEVKEAGHEELLGGFDVLAVWRCLLLFGRVF